MGQTFPSVPFLFRADHPAGFAPLSLPKLRTPDAPSPTLSSVIVQVVSSFVAVRPASPNCLERDMVKHPACAAASSSSGFVPTPFSNRVLNEYCVCLSVPLSVEIAPLPDFKSPCHTAEAL